MGEISKFSERGVSGKEERQEIVERVVRSDIEEREDEIVYDDSLDAE